VVSPSHPRGPSSISSRSLSLPRKPSTPRPCPDRRRPLPNGTAAFSRRARSSAPVRPQLAVAARDGRLAPLQSWSSASYIALAPYAHRPVRGRGLSPALPTSSLRLLLFGQFPPHFIRVVRRLPATPGAGHGPASASLYARHPGLLTSGRVSPVLGRQVRRHGRTLRPVDRGGRSPSRCSRNRPMPLAARAVFAAPTPRSPAANGVAALVPRSSGGTARFSRRGRSSRFPARLPSRAIESRLSPSAPAWTPRTLWRSLAAPRGLNAYPRYVGRPVLSPGTGRTPSFRPPGRGCHPGSPCRPGRLRAGTAWTPRWTAAVPCGARVIAGGQNAGARPDRATGVRRTPLSRRHRPRSLRGCTHASISRRLQRGLNVLRGPLPTRSRATRSPSTNGAPGGRLSGAVLTALVCVAGGASWPPRAQAGPISPSSSRGAPGVGAR